MFDYLWIILPLSKTYNVRTILVIVTHSRTFTSHLNSLLINVNAELSSYLYANIIEDRKSRGDLFPGFPSSVDWHGEPHNNRRPSAKKTSVHVRLAISGRALVKQQLHGSDSPAINSHLARDLFNMHTSWFPLFCCVQWP